MPEDVLYRTNPDDPGPAEPTLPLRGGSSGTDHPDRLVSVPYEALERLQRAASVGAVASSIAHEFNNILTTILNQAKMGCRTTDTDRMRTCHEKVLESAQRAAKVTTGILALSRNRSSRPQSVSPSELLEQVLSVLEKDLHKHQCRIEKRYQQTEPVEVVPAQIEHVLMNLLINARQAMPKGGRIQVSVEQNVETGMVEISVRDSGTGIDARHLPHIFEPFFTTKDGPDATGKGGSGLGLAICREVVERHRGRIRVESEPGKGTTFTIKLPFVELPCRAA